MISPTDNYYTIDKTNIKRVTNQISQTKANYYANQWIDSSTINLISTGKQFTNYQVEKSSTMKFEVKEN